MRSEWGISEQCASGRSQIDKEFRTRRSCSAADKCHHSIEQHMAKSPYHIHEMRKIS